MSIWGNAYVSELPFVILVHNIQVSKKLLILSFEFGYNFLIPSRVGMNDSGRRIFAYARLISNR